MLANTELDVHANKASYRKFTGIPVTNEISNGDELHNINCYEYLRNFSVIDPEAYNIDLSSNEYKVLGTVFYKNL